MNWKTVEKVAENPGKQWYYKLSEIAAMFGRDRSQVSNFLRAHAVPHYYCGKAKMYFLPEVLEALERTRQKA